MLVLCLGQVEEGLSKINFRLSAVGRSALEGLKLAALSKPPFIVTQIFPLASQFPHTKTSYLELFEGFAYIFISATDLLVCQVLSRLSFAKALKSFRKNSEKNH